MRKYFDSIIGSDGRPVAGASVTVTALGGGAPSSIFSDSAGSVPKTNPVVTDANGYFEFYAADGRYSLSITATGYGSRSLTDIALEDPADASQQTINGGSINNTPIGATTPSTGAFTTLSASGGITGNLTGNVSGNLTGNVTGAAHAFPATQVPSADPNTLDDYEEGTFTPTVFGSSTAGTATYATQVGNYTKIGNRVFFDLNLDWSGHTGTGNLGIAGLPFTSNAAAGTFTAVAVGSPANVAMTASNVMTAYIAPGTTQVSVGQYPAGGGALSVIPMDAAGGLTIAGHYRV